MGILNAANTEAVMNKLSHATKKLREMKRPLTTTIFEIAHQTVKNSKVLPSWHQVNQLEQLLILLATEKSQNDTGLALSCIQVQSWLQTLISEMVHHRYSGVIPIEICQLIDSSATEKELMLRNLGELKHF